MDVLFFAVLGTVHVLRVSSSAEFWQVSVVELGFSVTRCFCSVLAGVKGVFKKGGHMLCMGEALRN